MDKPDKPDKPDKLSDKIPAAFAPLPDPEDLPGVIDAECCGNCSAFRMLEQQAAPVAHPVGTCRADPPQVVLVQLVATRDINGNPSGNFTGRNDSMFPFTNTGVWCRQYQRKPKLDIRKLTTDSPVMGEKQ